jgi:hypothetical protein
MKSPTAVHRVAALHETPMSVVLRAPAGFGVGWIAHPEAAAVGAVVSATINTTATLIGHERVASGVERGSSSRSARKPCQERVSNITVTTSFWRVRQSFFM